jgi:hypothetical protein
MLTDGDTCASQLLAQLDVVAVRDAIRTDSTAITAS